MAGVPAVGNTELVLNTLSEMPDRPPLPDGNRNQHHFDTALYIGCPDVEACYAALKAKGIQAANLTSPVMVGKQWTSKIPMGITCVFSGRQSNL